MDRIQHLIQRIFPPAQPLAPGIYHYQAPADAPTPLRLHLRIDPDGEGVLIVTASTVLRLNQTAAELAYHLVKETPEAEIGKQMAARYRIQPEVALQDFRDFKQRLDTLIQTPDLDPVGFLGFERDAPNTSAVLAPYRLDCALTYRLTTALGRGLAPVDRVKRELLTEEWQTILQKAWDAGIPHAILTGGEPTLRPDLPELIAYTQSLGMVTGLLSNGSRLSDPDYLHSLLNNGLDHLMLILNPDDDETWEAMRDVLVEDIATTIHITLTEHTIQEITPLLDYLVRLGAHQVSLSVDDPALNEELQKVRQAVADRGLKLVWDLPVPYSQLHPIALELSGFEEAPQGHGKAWLYVEPDGDVLPAQGHLDEVLGNLLTDPWEKIWKPS